MTTRELPHTRPARLTVVIKALNEEGRIALAIESALRAVQHIGGEVVLADSCSTDRTVEIAAAYPIRIVQLAHPDERCCGAGPQLGYQHALGEYVYLMDGDMELLPGFLDRALAFLAQHPEVAGVGGRVVERNLESLEYRERAARERLEPHRVPGPVDRLDGGGLYRRCAIQEAGHLSDRNLHSYEEFELAVRLRARGWKLWRLPIDAVAHVGHETPPYKLLMRRWKSGYICGSGELLRSALGQPWLRLVWRNQREIRLYLGVLAWWAVLLTVPLWPMEWPLRAGALTALALAPVVLMSLRKRSLARGIYAVVSWCFNAAGLVRGLLHARKPTTEPIASRVLREPGGPGLSGRGAPGGASPGGAFRNAPLPPSPPSAHRS
ncbi:glycosyltransferase family 2 protein [Ramlibacter rhizophilus]|uniref:Glycosyltransferase n=1 Tax=Ramlibacter rhizophilus TaxID=1781167 RepID=A0A4Z0BKZ9_9BURK|nr:glycosyltransferase [Ramlibacter rhizophilus]TFZ00003.1 glycosyltransferase [Ramlibacter rhizophilus]